MRMTNSELVQALELISKQNQGFAMLDAEVEKLQHQLQQVKSILYWLKQVDKVYKGVALEIDKKEEWVTYRAVGRDIDRYAQVGICTNEVYGYSQGHVRHKYTPNVKVAKRNAKRWVALGEW